MHSSPWSGKYVLKRDPATRIANATVGGESVRYSLLSFDESRGTLCTIRPKKKKRKKNCEVSITRSSSSETIEPIENTNSNDESNIVAQITQRSRYYR